MNTQIRAIITDTGGTVFDWHTAVLDAFASVGSARGIEADWSSLTKTWRTLSTSMVDRGLPLVNDRVEVDMDDVLRETLETTLEQHKVSGFQSEDKNSLILSWRKMAPWDDIPNGIARLRRRLIVCPFTILKTALVIEASRGKVDWDAVISCEMIGVYKTNPKTYATAAKWLDLKKEEILLVTTHNNDLKAAHKFGMKTAFIYRPREWYDMPSLDPEPAPEADYVAQDFEDLASQLGF